MNHYALVRPTLPGSTPAPAPLGKSSVYATRVSPHLEPLPVTNALAYSQEMQGHLSPSYKGPDDTQQTMMHTYSTRNIKTPSETTKQRALQEKALSRMTSKLPYELRESVSAVVKMAFNASQRMQEDLDLNNQELVVLRAEVSNKTRDNYALLKQCQNFKEQIKGMQENIDSLKDEISTRQNFTIRNRSAMTRLASTNRMLIDVLDALQTQTGGVGGNALLQELARQAEQDVEDEALTEGSMERHKSRRGPKSPLAALVRTPKGTSAQEYEEKVQRMTMFQNDKLRESLLKVAREQYRSTKNSEVLEIKVNELKNALRAQESLNRKLKSELDEIKVIHKVEVDHVEEAKPGLEVAKSFKIKSFGHIDQRFQALLDRNVFDPIDGIQQLRRILAHMSSAPCSLSLFDMIEHIVNPDVMQIFDSDMICLYLVKPGQETVMHKFTTRSKHAVSLDMASTRSVAAETIKTGKLQRLNILSNCHFYHTDIDGCTGVLTKRILSLPLVHSQNQSVLGAVQFLNKAQGRDAFAEVDELFGVIFANQTAVYLSNCVLYDAMFYHAQLMQGLLEASTELFSVVPDASIVPPKPLTPGEILFAMGRISRNLLKCSHTKAFVVSEVLLMGEGMLVALQHTRSSSTKDQQSLVSIPAHSGIAGYVVREKKAYLLEDSGMDEFWNPEADLDPLNDSMLTVPLMDLHGRILGCLQLISSARSPRMKPSEDIHDFRLLFPQAAQWLAHQMAPALEYLLSHASLGRPVRRPASTPSRLTRSSADLGHRPSFISSTDEMVTQVTAPEEAAFYRAQDHESNQKDSYGSNQGKTSTFITMPALESCQKDDSKDLGYSPAQLSPVEKKVVRFEVLDNASSSNNKSVVAIEEFEDIKVQLAQKDSELAKLREDLETMRLLVNTHGEERNAMLDEFEAHKHEYVVMKEEVSRLVSEGNSLRKQIGESQSAHDKERREIVKLQEQLKLLNDEKEVLKATLDEERERATHVQNKNVNWLEKSEQWSREKTELLKQITAADRNGDTRDAELATLKGIISQLQKDLEQKDKVQAILQEQVVKLAGRNIKDLDAAIEQQSSHAANNDNNRSTTIADTGKGVTRREAGLNSSLLPANFVKNLNKEAVPIKTKDEDWEQQTDQYGQMYYVNKLTGESRWTLEDGSNENNSGNAAAAPVVKGHWLQQFDELGREYWVHQVTGQSVWEVPEEQACDDEEEDEDGKGGKIGRSAENSIFDSNASHFSATAGDYTIEL